MEYPAFAYPSKFAEISGLSLKEIYKLCHSQVIPNERTNHGFRIDVDGAITALQHRAMNFIGHKGARIRTKAPERPVSMQTVRRKEKSFLEQLEALKSG